MHKINIFIQAIRQNHEFPMIFATILHKTNRTCLAIVYFLDTSVLGFERIGCLHKTFKPFRLKTIVGEGFLLVKNEVFCGAILGIIP